MMFFFDKKFKERLTAIDKKIGEAGDKYLQRYIQVEQTSRYKKLAESTKMIQNNSTGERVFQELMNYQSNLYREMFQELILLFKRMNELSGKRILDWRE